MSSIPTATGVFAEKPLAHLLVHILERSLSGALEVATTGAQQATVQFQRGLVTKIRTSAPICYLGSVLYELGYIDSGELDASLMQLAKTKLPHGQVLLERGSISREQLASALREQALRKLTHLFSFAPDTVFSFYAHEDRLVDYGGREAVAVDPLPAIWRGVRDLAAGDHVTSVLQRLGRGRVRLAGTTGVERLRLQADEQAIVDCLRAKPMGLDELGRLGVIPPSTLHLLVYCLLITKQISVVLEAVEAPRNVSETRFVAARPDPRQDHEPTTAADLVATGAKTLLDGVRVALRQNNLDRAQRLARAAHQEDPHDAAALALFAWTGAIRPENQDVESTLARIALLDRAVEMNVLCQDALYYRAQLHSRLENHRHAVRDLQRVIELNPEHPEAVRALRLYYLRVRRGSVAMRAVDPHAAPAPKASGVMTRPDASASDRFGRRSG